MNIFKNLFLFNKKSEKNKNFNPQLVDQYIEIAKLVKEARIQQNISIKNYHRRDSESRLHLQQTSRRKTKFIIFA